MTPIQPDNYFLTAVATGAVIVASTALAALSCRACSLFRKASPPPPAIGAGVATPAIDPSRVAPELPHLYYPDPETMQAFAEENALPEELSLAGENWMTSPEEARDVAQEYLQIRQSQEAVNVPISNRVGFFNFPKISAAIVDNNYPRMLALMLHGANINSHTCLCDPSDSQLNPLSHAAQHFERDERFLRLLLREKAQLDSTNLLVPAQFTLSSTEALRTVLTAYPEAARTPARHGVQPAGDYIFRGFDSSPNSLKVLFEHGGDPEVYERGSHGDRSMTLLDVIEQKKQNILEPHNPQDVKTAQLTILKKNYEVVREAIRGKIKKEHETELLMIAFSLREKELSNDSIKSVADQYLAPFYEGRLPPPWSDNDPDDASTGTEPPANS